MRPRALVTGIAGQDGSYLAELLLAEGYEVFGVTRTGSADGYTNLDAIRDELNLVEADLLDKGSLVEALRSCRARRGLQPGLRLVRARLVGRARRDGQARGRRRHRDPRGNSRGGLGIRFYQASSSEIFGDPVESPQGPDTPLGPLLPTGLRRPMGTSSPQLPQRYGLHASSGILFNHESPRRPPSS